MQNIELVIFDMAGTTVNEDNVVYKTLRKAINENGYDLPLKFVLEHGAGKEKHQAIRDILMQHEGVDRIEKYAMIFKEFKMLLKQAYQNLEVSAYPGAEELIGALKKANIKVALNTGYDQGTAQLLLDKMKWSVGVKYDVLITADDVQLGRPNPDMIFKAMDLLQIDEPYSVIKVGDSIIDIEEGKNASCGMTIGVTTGAHTQNQLASANPTYVLNSLVELKNILIR